MTINPGADHTITTFKAAVMYIHTLKSKKNRCENILRLDNNGYLFDLCMYDLKD
jgi:hypothetical protein